MHSNGTYEPKHPRHRSRELLFPRKQVSLHYNTNFHQKSKRSCKINISSALQYTTEHVDIGDASWKLFYFNQYLANMDAQVFSSTLPCMWQLCEWLGSTRSFFPGPLELTLRSILNFPEVSWCEGMRTATFRILIYHAFLTSFCIKTLRNSHEGGS